MLAGSLGSTFSNVAAADALSVMSPNLQGEFSGSPRCQQSEARGEQQQRGGFGDRVDSQKPMLPRCIVICSHNFTATIDPEDQGLCRARGVDRREGSSTVHKAMRP